MNEWLIVVCIPTRRRRNLLRNCLLAVSALQTPDTCRVEIVVVDNDESGTARPVCKELATSGSLPLHYFVEAEAGLSSVRNRLLEEALKLGANLLAFVDDDEQPDPGWLVHHVAALQQSGADVVTGPVRPLSTGPLPMPAKSRQSGWSPRHVSTNNVLMKADLALQQGLRFDPFFNFIGGEDFDFFERSKKLGNVHVWVEEAVVYEIIPAARSSLRYLFYRHFSGGINSILRYKRDNPTWRAWLRFAPKILGKLFGGILYVFLSCIKMSRPHFATAVKKTANGLGYLAGLLNVIVERYRNIATDDINDLPRAR